MPTLDYHNAPTPPHPAFAILFRLLSLALSAAACAILIWFVHPFWRNAIRKPIFCVTCILTVLITLGFALRAVGIQNKLTREPLWSAATGIFALFTLIVLSNQFHGMPPPSDRYVIAGGCLSSLLSTLGLIYDRRIHIQPKHNPPKDNAPSYQIKQDDSTKRASFGAYTYRIYDGDRLIAKYWHDYRGDEHGIEFIDGRSEDWPLGRMIDFVQGGGPEPLRLSDRAQSYLRTRQRRGDSAGGIPH